MLVVIAREVERRGEHEEGRREKKVRKERREAGRDEEKEEGRRS